MDKEYIINDNDLVTKAGWSPFNGVKVKGVLERFIFNGECVYNNRLSDNLRNGQNVNIYKNNTNSMTSNTNLKMIVILMVLILIN